MLVKEELTIPGREEINIHGSLDEDCACENLLGKSLDERCAETDRGSAA